MILSKYIIEQISELDESDEIKKLLKRFLEFEEEIENRRVKGSEITKSFDSFLGQLARDKTLMHYCDDNDEN